MTAFRLLISFALFALLPFSSFAEFSQTSLICPGHKACWCVSRHSPNSGENYAMGTVIRRMYQGPCRDWGFEEVDACETITAQKEKPGWTVCEVAEEVARNRLLSRGGCGGRMSYTHETLDESGCCAVTATCRGKRAAVSLEQEISDLLDGLSMPEE